LTERRQVTLVLFLESSREAEPSGGFNGGLLRLFPDEGDPIDVVARQGMLVAFPASMRHEVTRVRSGRRDTIVDWFY
jgi:predicted 2-oxoglutarate/Fe(II)-dependent dioxygenase YbiX